MAKTNRMPMPTHTHTLHLRIPTNFAAHATWEKGLALITESLGYLGWPTWVHAISLAKVAQQLKDQRKMFTQQCQNKSAETETALENRIQRYKVMLVVRPLEKWGKLCPKRHEKIFSIERKTL